MNIIVGNDHKEHCDHYARADFYIGVLSYHDKELEIGIYACCSDCGQDLGQTTATMTLVGSGEGTQ